MRVALTGATGFIGSHVLTELHEHGHEVVALIRDDAAAECVAGHGATPARIDLTDGPAVVSLLGGADAAITRPARATRPAHLFSEDGVRKIMIASLRYWTPSPRSAGPGTSPNGT